MNEREMFEQLCKNLGYVQWPTEFRLAAVAVIIVAVVVIVTLLSEFFGS